jgi:hypothetical protein
MSRSPGPVAGLPRRRPEPDAPSLETLPHLCLNPECPGATCVAVRMVLSAAADRLALAGLLPKVKRETLAMSAAYDRADVITELVTVWDAAGQPFMPTAEKLPDED